MNEEILSAKVNRETWDAGGDYGDMSMWIVRVSSATFKNAHYKHFEYRCNAEASAREAVGRMATFEGYDQGYNEMRAYLVED